MKTPDFTDGQIVGIHSCIIICENNPKLKGSELGNILKNNLDVLKNIAR